MGNFILRMCLWISYGRILKKWGDSYALIRASLLFGAGSPSASRFAFVRCRKSRRGPPSGPVGVGGGGEGEKPPGGPARDGRPFPLRQEVESETSTRSPTRPEGQ